MWCPRGDLVFRSFCLFPHGLSHTCQMALLTTGKKEDGTIQSCSNGIIFVLFLKSVLFFPSLYFTFKSSLEQTLKWILQGRVSAFQVHARSFPQKWVSDFAIYESGQGSLWRRLLLLLLEIETDVFWPKRWFKERERWKKMEIKTALIGCDEGEIFLIWFVRKRKLAFCIMLHYSNINWNCLLESFQRYE